MKIKNFPPLREYIRGLLACGWGSYSVLLKNNHVESLYPILILGLGGILLGMK